MSGAVTLLRYVAVALIAVNRVAMSWGCPPESKVTEYHFHTKLIEGNKITINGRKKAPAIHVRNGACLSVRVTNGIPADKITQGLSIHWHGLNMRDNQVFDGVVGLTQCPIAYGETYNYKWLVHEQPGTYWYHTHDRKPFPGQQVDLVRGPLIIHEKDYEDEHNVIGSDKYAWGKERILFFTTPNYLNGDSSHPNIDVENGKYKFRIINGDGQNSYYFSIQGHDLTVIATDGYPVESYMTHVIQVSIAERYDAWVDFSITDHAKNIWIRATPKIANIADGTYGILRIRKGEGSHYAPEPPSNSAKLPTLTNKKVLNCYEKPGESLQYKCSDVTELKSKVERNLLNTPIYYTVDVNYMETKSTETFKIAINGGDFIMNEIPCLPGIKNTARSHWGRHTNVLSLPIARSVTIVLRSITWQFDMFHPMHMHGHHFEILEIVTQPVVKNCPLVDLETGFSVPIKQLMKRKEKGVLKDTVFLPSCGAVALRIHSDNPGVWFFHCHIPFHLYHGLAVVLNEDGYLFSQAEKDFPKDYPTCTACNQGIVRN